MRRGRAGSCRATADALHQDVRLVHVAAQVAQRTTAARGCYPGSSERASGANHSGGWCVKKKQASWRLSPTLRIAAPSALWSCVWVDRELACGSCGSPSWRKDRVQPHEAEREAVPLNRGREIAGEESGVGRACAHGGAAVGLPPQTPSTGRSSLNRSFTKSRHSFPAIRFPERRAQVLIVGPVEQRPEEWARSGLGHRRSWLPGTAEEHRARANVARSLLKSFSEPFARACHTPRPCR